MESQQVKDRCQSGAWFQKYKLLKSVMGRARLRIMHETTVRLASRSHVMNSFLLRFDNIAKFYLSIEAALCLIRI